MRSFTPLIKQSLRPLLEELGLKPEEITSLTESDIRELWNKSQNGDWMLRFYSCSYDFEIKHYTLVQSHLANQVSYIFSDWLLSESKFETINNKLVPTSYTSVGQHLKDVLSGIEAAFQFGLGTITREELRNFAITAESGSRSIARLAEISREKYIDGFRDDYWIDETIVARKALKTAYSLHYGNVKNSAYWVAKCFSKVENKFSDARHLSSLMDSANICRKYIKDCPRAFKV